MSRKQHWVEVMQRADAERNGPASEHLLVHPDQARLLPESPRRARKRKVAQGDPMTRNLFK
ncbi:hypothetical protein IIA79_02490 [bacterium]|nr:hypothetical protein [bacterium]